jgi:hypothetical protein
LKERLRYVMCSEDNRRIIDISSLFASKKPEAIMTLPGDTGSSHSSIKRERNVSWGCSR